MTLESLAATVLTIIAERCEDAATAPQPKIWRWEIERWEDAIDFGPRYTPSWFGEITATEAGRQRELRMIRWLEADGLLEIANYRGRMARVKLTDAGRGAVEALRSAPSV